MPSETVYVVYGSCGSYSDYREWAVAAFTVEQRAKDWAEKCRQRAEEEIQRLTAEGKPLHEWKDKTLVCNYSNPYDPDMMTDGDDGPEYTVGAVPLEPVEP